MDLCRDGVVLNGVAHCGHNSPSSWREEVLQQVVQLVPHGSDVRPEKLNVLPLSLLTGFHLGFAVGFDLVDALPSWFPCHGGSAPNPWAYPNLHRLCSVAYRWCATNSCIVKPMSRAMQRSSPGEISRPLCTGTVVARPSPWRKRLCEPRWRTSSNPRVVSIAMTSRDLRTGTGGTEPRPLPPACRQTHPPSWVCRRRGSGRSPP